MSNFHRKGSSDGPKHIRFESSSDADLSTQTAQTVTKKKKKKKDKEYVSSSLLFIINKVTIRGNE